MYKLLIVDDEDIEREGMAGLIQWQDYGTELVGTAWNGFDGLKKISELEPDIVLTDVKMPVMDGIELIRQGKQKYPDTVFVVLSGYGEYEFTSQAMEEGVRHYLLKPCDEEKIVGVLKKAQAEVDEIRDQKNREDTYRSTMKRLLPRAKEQIFRNLLLERVESEQESRRFIREIGNGEKQVRILVLRGQESFDDIEQFVLENVLGELLGDEKILLNTVVRSDSVFLLEDVEVSVLGQAVQRTKEEFGKFKDTPVIAAVSEKGTAEEASALYGQAQELLRMGEKEERSGLLSRDAFLKEQERTGAFLKLSELRQAKDYVEILQEIYLCALKMRLRGENAGQMKQVFQWILKLLYGGELPPCSDETEENALPWELIETAVNETAKQQEIFMEQTKEEKRVKDMLLGTFQYIHRPEMSLQFLAKEVLFMNEDYAGRIFLKNRKIRFSAFLVRERMYLAKELLAYEPDIRISSLAEQLGYSFDGQYFSKVFRRENGESPTEFRDRFKKAKTEEI